MAIQCGPSEKTMQVTFMQEQQEQPGEFSNQRMEVKPGLPNSQNKPNVVIVSNGKTIDSTLTQMARAARNAAR